MSGAGTRIRASIASQSEQVKTDVEQNLTLLEDENRDLQARLAAAQLNAADNAQQLTTAVEIEAFLTANVNNAADTLNNRRRLSEILRFRILKNDFNGQFLDPNFDQTVSYAKLENPDFVQPARDSKMFSKLGVFFGDPSKTPDWAGFLDQLSVLAMNCNYSESELKQQFITHMAGPAFEFFRSIPNCTRLSLSDLIDKMSLRYKIDPTQALNELRAMIQLPQERVEDFAARMYNMARNVEPKRPSDIVVWKVDNQSFVIPNPKLNELLNEYNAQKKTIEVQLLGYFLHNLKPEIRSKLPAKMFSTFDEVRTAAREAEWTLDTISSFQLTTQMNHLNLDPTDPSQIDHITDYDEIDFEDMDYPDNGFGRLEQVNNMRYNPRGRFQNRRFQYRSSSYNNFGNRGRGAYNPMNRNFSRPRMPPPAGNSQYRPCHICQDPSHWANQCPMRFSQTQRNSNVNNSSLQSEFAEFAKWKQDSGKPALQSNHLEMPEINESESKNL